MKKRRWWLIPILAAVALAVLTVPFSVMSLNDGGTVEYRALTYTLVKWNRLQETDPNYQATRVYPFSLFTSIDALWERERPSQDDPPADSRTEDRTFRATVLEVKNNFLMVEPLTGEEERRSSDKITLTAPAGTAVELLQSVRHGGGGPVGAEADQGAVHVEEHGFYHKITSFRGENSCVAFHCTRRGGRFPYAFSTILPAPGEKGITPGGPAIKWGQRKGGEGHGL